MNEDKIKCFGNYIFLLMIFQWRRSSWFRNLFVIFIRCSTIGAIIMTPLLTKLLAGQLVPVDAAVSMLSYSL